MDRLVHVLALLLTASFVSANEVYGTSQSPLQDTVPVNNFSYVGLTGPLNWFGLNESANSLCDKGIHQSPINIDNTISIVEGSTVKFHVPDVTSAYFENTGTNVEVVTNGTLVAGGKSYKLAQFHYHTPSEHRVLDEYFPMEEHWVFEAADGSIAVVGFLIEIDDNGFTGPLLSTLFDVVGKIATPGDETLAGPLHFTATTQHLYDNSIYSYEGSLTTPPCSESVAWYISTKPLRISVDRYLSAKSVLKFNSRYTQDTLGKPNLLENAAKELDS